MRSMLVLAGAALVCTATSAYSGPLGGSDRNCQGTDAGITVQFLAEEISARPGSSHQIILVNEGNPAEITGATKNAICTSPGGNGSLKVRWSAGKVGKQGGGLWGVFGEPVFNCSIDGENVEVDCK